MSAREELEVRAVVFALGAGALAFLPGEAKLLLPGNLVSAGQSTRPPLLYEGENRRQGRHKHLKTKA